MANMMECRKFYITLVSAYNLPDLRRLGKMKIYAEVSINGESNTSKKTNVDTVGETNPRWNFTFDYTINESSIHIHGAEVVVKLYCERTMGDKYIGQVKIPVKTLFDSRVKAVNELNCTVAETRDGTLNILYSFGDMFYAEIEKPPSRWKKAKDLGVMVMVQGAWFLLTGEFHD